MSNDKEQKHPYMYIVQPEISPPDSNMQSQFRAIVDQEAVEVSDEDSDVKHRSSDEIVIVSSEKIDVNNTAKEKSFYEVEENVEDSKEVIEVSTGIQSDQKDAKNKRRTPKRKMNKKQKFSDMTKEELVTFLARMPAAVPKPTCFMIINGKRIRGQIQRKRGEEYLVKILLGDRNDTIVVKIDEIEEIKVENL